MLGWTRDGEVDRKRGWSGKSPPSLLSSPALGAAGHLGLCEGEDNAKPRPLLKLKGGSSHSRVFCVVRQMTAFTAKPCFPSHPHPASFCPVLRSCTWILGEHFCHSTITSTYIGSRALQIQSACSNKARPICQNLVFHPVPAPIFREQMGPKRGSLLRSSTSVAWIHVHCALWVGVDVWIQEPCWV